tara:strand:- start:2074 stop:2259 length:186 start_codon:yes stop_codon:yes gene_type:complete
MSKPTFYDQQDKGLHHEHKTNGSVGLAAALWIRRSLHAGVGAATLAGNFLAALWACSWLHY